MVRPKTSSKQLTQNHELHIVGVRILSRVSFALVVMLAAFLNEADQMARAKGLISVRVEAPTMFFGTHACMQPEAVDLPEEAPPEDPPCPRKRKQ